MGGVNYGLPIQVERDFGNDFIPIVAIDLNQIGKENSTKEWKYEGFQIIKGTKTVELNKNLDLDKINQLLHTIEIRQSEVVVRFLVNQANSKATDNDGIIEIKPNGVNVLTKKKISIEYGKPIALRISKKDIKDNAYIDFYAHDDGKGFWDDMGLSNIHCGRVLIEPNLTNVLILDGNNKPKDKALQYIIVASKKLSSNVVVLYAKNKKDMLKQLKKEFPKAKIGNIVIFGHGNYFDSGTYIGKDYINTNKEYSELGTQLAPFLDSKKSQIVLYACHSAVGSTPKESKENMQNLAKSAKTQVIANMTWGLSSTRVFDGMFSPVFEVVPPNSNAHQKPNSVKYIGYSALYYTDGKVNEKIKIYHTKELETVIK